MWFEQLTGFQESAEQVRAQLQLHEQAGEAWLTSQVTGRVLGCGRFAAPTLAQLRQQVAEVAAFAEGSAPISASAAPVTPARLRLREVVGNVQTLHQDPSNAGALFQVASQFNGLEMVGPSITPEHGISGYQYDRTQGPACAIACGAGTLYRNYFVDLSQYPHTGAAAAASQSANLVGAENAAAASASRGQTAKQQLDLIQALADELASRIGVASVWQMQNGYLMLDEVQLSQIANYLRAQPDSELDRLRSMLRIAMQWHTEVTLPATEHGASPQANSSQSASSQASGHPDSCDDALAKNQAVRGHRVSQAYCSALPVAYNHHSADLWQPFAQLALDAAYEATFAAAVLNAQQTGNRTVFLTQLGGGAFGNRSDWILSAIERAIRLYQQHDLDVVMVSYSGPSALMRELRQRVGKS